MAKIRKPKVEVGPGGIPAELLDQLHPLWSDLDAIRAHPVFGRYVADAQVESYFQIRAGRPPSAAVYWRIATPWMLENGFTEDRNTLSADLHKFRTAADPG